VHASTAVLTENERQRVGDGQREEVVVGGGVHVTVASDHHARRHVSNDARHQYHAVDDAERYGGRRTSVPLTQVRRQVLHDVTRPRIRIHHEGQINSEVRVVEIPRFSRTEHR